MVTDGLVCTPELLARLQRLADNGVLGGTQHGFDVAALLADYATGTNRLAAAEQEAVELRRLAEAYVQQHDHALQQYAPCLCDCCKRARALLTPTASLGGTEGRVNG